MPDMKPGLEMDVAVARALGWHDVAVPGKATYWTRGSEVMTPLRCYSQTDTGAFAALDEVLAKHPEWFFSLQWDDDNKWHAMFWHAPYYLGATCDTRAEALCRAILALAEQETEI